MTDIEMLEVFYLCCFLSEGCGKCNLFHDKECYEKKKGWLKEYIQRLKRQEDDLK